MKIQRYGRCMFRYLGLIVSVSRGVVARDAARVNRTNGNTKDIERLQSKEMPGDGKYKWTKGEERAGYVYGQKRPDGRYDYEVEYHAGPKDVEWFCQIDCNYLSRLEREGNLKAQEPAVWALRELDRARRGKNVNDIRAWWRGYIFPNGPNGKFYDDKVLGALLQEVEKLSRSNDWDGILKRTAEKAARERQEAGRKQRSAAIEHEKTVKSLAAAEIRLKQFEERLTKRAADLERRAETLSKRETDLMQREREIMKREASLKRTGEASERAIEAAAPVGQQGAMTNTVVIMLQQQIKNLRAMMLQMQSQHNQQTIMMQQQHQQQIAKTMERMAALQTKVTPTNSGDFGSSSGKSASNIDSAEKEQGNEPAPPSYAAAVGLDGYDSFPATLSSSSSASASSSSSVGSLASDFAHLDFSSGSAPLFQSSNTRTKKNTQRKYRRYKRSKKRAGNIAPNPSSSGFFSTASFSTNVSCPSLSEKNPSLQP